MLVTARPPACRQTDRQRCHQTAAWRTPTSPPLAPPHHPFLHPTGHPSCHLQPQPVSQHPHPPQGQRHCGALTLPQLSCPCPGQALSPREEARVALHPQRCPERSPATWNPLHPHASTGAGCRQDPQHLPQLGRHLGAARAGRGGRFPVAFAVVLTSSADAHRAQPPIPAGCGTTGVSPASSKAPC